MLSLADQWVWDSWIADDGERYHLFFLQAPKSLGSPQRRHTAARIGRASSTDLVEWQYHGVALAPSENGWDDLALWTGSVVPADDGTWRMFYTALNTGGRGVYDQRVGMAASDDLTTWRRVGDRPLLLADPRWYQTLGSEVPVPDGLVPDPAASETWRDPFVFRDPDGDGWHMLVTARRRGASRFDDGVLAHARSADLVSWELGPPVSHPEGFGQIEVPQVRVVAGRPVLVFTCHPDEQAEFRKQAHGHYCTWSVPADTMTGDATTGRWDLTRARPLRAEPQLFAAPLVQDRSGQWVLVGFRNNDPHGVTAFEITDPIPVDLVDGALVVRPPA